MEKKMDCGKIKTYTGTWNESEELSFFNVQRKNIYQSESEPSFVAWCLLWKDGDGTLKTSFVEVNGEKGLWPPTFDFNGIGIESRLTTLASSDNGKSWYDTGWKEEFDPLWTVNSDHHIRYVTALPDGTLLRLYPHTRADKTLTLRHAVYDSTQFHKLYSYSPAEIEYHPKNTTIWVSRDKGQRWEMTGRLETIFVSGFHILKDGSIVGIGCFIKENGELTAKPAIVESFDGGRTWGEPYAVFEDEETVSSFDFSEEADFAECSDGRLLVMWRAVGGPKTTKEFYLERDASGKWCPSCSPQDTGTPLYNYPYLYKASDGTLFLYHFRENIYYSLDEGKTWKVHPFGQSYYGQLTEIAPGKILTVTHDDFDDNMYPHPLDLGIFTTTFDYKRVQALEQIDPSVPMAVASVDEKEYSNFHLRVNMRVDGANGVIFSRKNNNYNFIALTLPTNPCGSSNIGCEHEGTYLVCGKCEDGKITVIRRQLLSIAGVSLSAGDWVQVQVKAEDGIVTAAVRTAESRAFYTVLNELETQGEVGLFTNKCTGAFKEVSLGHEPKKLRDNWKL